MAHALLAGGVMTSPLSYFKRKAVMWIVALTLAVPLLYLQDYFQEDGLNCRPAPVPPRVNADGTVDHVLIRKCEGGKGRYVIMRFAADQQVRASKNMAPTEVGGFGGPTVTLSSSTNQYLVAFYDMSNGWKPFTKAEFSKKEGYDHIAEIVFTRWEDDLTAWSLARNMKEAETSCEKPIRHANGILEYRLKEGRDPRVYPRCFLTFVEGKDPRGLCPRKTCRGF